MTGMTERWCGTEFDKAENRAKFRRALMKACTEFGRNQRCTNSITTPHWDSTFIDWLIYDCTLIPAGCVCTHKDDSMLLFEADSSGCQEEGICLNATFAIPAEEFTPKQLKEIVPGTGEYYPAKLKRKKVDGKTAIVYDLGPFRNRGYIVKLRWSYDGMYDETRKE